jgi:hypothetical protein
MIQLTQVRLDELMTDRGGHTYATMRAMGVEFDGKGNPFPWRRRLLNTYITDEQWQEALIGRNEPVRGRHKTGNDGPSLFDMPPR